MNFMANVSHKRGNTSMSEFKLQAPYVPIGEQPQAIEELVNTRWMGSVL